MRLFVNKQKIDSMSVAEMLEIKIESLQYSRHFAIALSIYLRLINTIRRVEHNSIMNADSDDTFFNFNQAAAKTFSFIQGEKYRKFASNYKKKCH